MAAAPDLSVQWSKNNEDLDPMWSTSNLLIRRFLLKIHRTHVNDAGVYRCNVVNGFGHVQAQFQVNVKCKYSFIIISSCTKKNFILANGTSVNKIVNNEQQNVIPWDVDSLNGGKFSRFFQRFF